MLGPLCNQTVNLESDAKTLYLYYSLLKLKYSPFIYLKHKKDQKKYASLKNSHINHTNRITTKNLQIDRPLFASYRTHAMNYFVSL